MVFWYEIKKLIFVPAFIGFALLCIVVNTIIVFSNKDMHYYDNNSAPSNIFEEYSTERLADHYINKYGLTGQREENVRKKYIQLQPIINKKAIDGDANSVYFGQGTYQMHRILFGSLMLMINAEAGILALLIALLSVGYESRSNTETIVYTSKWEKKYF